jgi:Protein of unknown function (DUF2034)
MLSSRSVARYASTSLYFRHINLHITASQRHYRTKTKPQPTLAHSSNLSTSTPSTLPPPPPLILPGSQHHSSLPTFLTHARQTNLSPTSTVYIGTYYEYTVLSALAPLGFNLIRVGRTSDAGIDLLGTWTLPHLPAPLRVVVQCKRHARALRPEHVRELEGAVQGAPVGWRGAVGLLVSPREASRGVRERIWASKLAVGYLMVDADGHGNGEDDAYEGRSGAESLGDVDAERAAGGIGDGLVTNEGKVRQFLWNWVAQERGLEGLGVTVKYTPMDGRDGKEIDREIALTWNGWIIKKMKELGPESPTVVVPLESLEQDEIPAPKKKRGRPRKTETTELVTQISKTKGKADKATRPRGQKKKK